MDLIGRHGIDRGSKIDWPRLRRHFQKTRRPLVIQQRSNIVLIGAAPGVTGDDARLIHHHASLETRNFEILTICKITIKKNAPLKCCRLQSLIKEKLRSGDYLNEQHLVALKVLGDFIPLGDVFREDHICKRDYYNLPAQICPIQTRRAVTLQLVPNERRRNVTTVLRTGEASEYRNQP